MPENAALVGTVEHVTITGIANMAGKDLPGLAFAGDAVNQAVADSLPHLAANPTIRSAIPGDVAAALREISGKAPISAAEATELSAPSLTPAGAAVDRAPKQSR